MTMPEAPDPTQLTVRTVTVFLPTEQCLDRTAFPRHLSTACARANALRDHLTSAGVAVQTTRVALPGPGIFATRAIALSVAKELDNAAVDFASLGTVHPSDPPCFLDPSFFCELIAGTSTVFATLTVTTSSGDPSLPAIRVAAETISLLAPHAPSGVANMRFAALANVSPGCPFFPASFASSVPAPPAALGVQAAPLLHAGPLAGLPARIERAADRLVAACAPVCPVACDFSTAPLPGWSTSAVAPIARAAGAGERRFGAAGTLAAAAAVASALDRANFPRAGLCGLMLPVAEDSALAAADRTLRINDFLMTSSVCGTGLDMIPLPGDISIPVLQRIVADVAALSARLGRKQLTARLLPIPGKEAGDISEFDSPFLVNGPILDVSDGIEGDGEIEELHVNPWQRR